MSQKWHNKPSVCRIVELSGSLLNRHCSHGMSAKFLRLEGSRKSCSINMMVAIKYLKCIYNDTFASTAFCPPCICKVCSPRVLAPGGMLAHSSLYEHSQGELQDSRNQVQKDPILPPLKPTLFHVTRSIATPEGLVFTGTFLHAFNKSVTRVQHVPRVSQYSRVLWKQENRLLQQSGILVSQKETLMPQEKPHGTQGDQQPASTLG